ncbi:MAG: hypothetical protein FJ247_01145 [Nitrospira sp.]|nr:hypothetical protein [Nitrospira sp.]
MMTYLSPIRPRFFRRSLMLLILCWIGAVWGCTALADVEPTQIRCPGSVQTKVSTTKHTVSVSYTEPSVSIGGKPLTDLAKTTIYYDLGNGRVPAKELPATKPTGGGQISQTITVPVAATGEQTVRICVTATDRHGNESPMVP